MWAGVGADWLGGGVGVGAELRVGVGAETEFLIQSAIVLRKAEARVSAIWSSAILVSAFLNYKLVEQDTERGGGRLGPNDVTSRVLHRNRK